MCIPVLYTDVMLYSYYFIYIFQISLAHSINFMIFNTIKFVYFIGNLNQITPLQHS